MMSILSFHFFFFNYTATNEIYTYLHTLSLHDALPIWKFLSVCGCSARSSSPSSSSCRHGIFISLTPSGEAFLHQEQSNESGNLAAVQRRRPGGDPQDRKSTRLNSSH